MSAVNGDAVGEIIDSHNDVAELDDGQMIAALYNLVILQSFWIRAKITKQKIDESDFVDDLTQLTKMIAVNVARRSKE